MRSRDIVVFIVSALLSVLFIIWNWIDKHIMMSDIPFQFSMHEGLSFNVSILFAVWLLIIVLFFSGPIPKSGDGDLWIFHIILSRYLHK